MTHTRSEVDELLVNKADLIDLLSRLLDKIDSHADDWTALGGCRKCPLHADDDKYWDCP